MFKIETHASAQTSVMEVMAIEKGSDVKIGTALVITDGKLVVASGAAKPTHVAARDAQAEDETLHVYRVLGTDEWQTTIKREEDDEEGSDAGGGEGGGAGSDAGGGEGGGAGGDAGGGEGGGAGGDAGGGAGGDAGSDAGGDADAVIAADAVIGEKYTISSDGQHITATTGGAFEVSRAWHDGETYYACGRFV